MAAISKMSSQKQHVNFYQNWILRVFLTYLEKENLFVLHQKKIGGGISSRMCYVMWQVGFIDIFSLYLFIPPL